MHIPTPADLAARRPRRLGPASSCPEVTVARRDGIRADPVQVLAAVAELLTPCAPPDTANGWTLCAHAQPWPCPVTRAAWLVRGLVPAPRAEGSGSCGMSARSDDTSEARR